MKIKRFFIVIHKCVCILKHLNFFIINLEGGINVISLFVNFVMTLKFCKKFIRMIPGTQNILQICFIRDPTK